LAIKHKIDYSGVPTDKKGNIAIPKVLQRPRCLGPHFNRFAACRWLVFAIVVAGLMGQSARATVYTWALSSGTGNWSTTTSWSPVIGLGPNSPGAECFCIGSSNSSGGIVYTVLDRNPTIGLLNYSRTASGTWIVAASGTNTLYFDNTGGHQNVWGGNTGSDAAIEATGTRGVLDTYPNMVMQSDLIVGTGTATGCIMNLFGSITSSVSGGSSLYFRTGDFNTNLNGVVNVFGNVGTSGSGAINIVCDQTGSNGAANSVQLLGVVGTNVSSLTMSGGTSGLMVLGGSVANTFTGVTTVNSGNLLLSVGTASGYGAQAVGANLIVNGGSATLGWYAQTSGSTSITLNSGTFNMNDYDATAGSLTLAGGTIAGPGNLTVGGCSLHAGVITAQLIPSGSAQVSGGLVILSGNNSDIAGSVTNLASGTLSLRGGYVASSTMSFNGGTLQFSSSSLTDYSDSIFNSASPISLDTNGQSVGFVHPIDASNTGGLTKLGAGTLTLYYSQNYSGPTNVNAGTLVLFGSSSGNSPVSVANNAALSAQAYYTTASLPGLTLNSGAAFDMIDGYIGKVNLGSGPLAIGGTSAATLTFELSGSTGADQITTSGSAAVGAGGGIISILSIVAPVPGSYPLITAGSGLGGNFSLSSVNKLTFNNQAYPASLSITATGVQLVIGSAAGVSVAYWGGTASSSWSYSNNWFTNASGSLGAGAAPSSLTDVYFSTTSAMNLNSNTVDQPSFAINSLNFTAVSGPVTISGTGALTVGVGGITVASGGSAQTINVPLTLSAGQSWTNNSTSALSIGGSVNDNGYQLAVNGSGPVLLSGGLSGTGSLVKSGSGTLVLGASNGYSGGTTLTAGALSLGNSNALGSGTLAINGGTLEAATALGGTVANPIILGGAALLGGSNSFALSGNLTLTGGPTFSPAAGATLILSGEVSGPFAITMSGPGQLILSNANNSYGSTYVSAGTLVVTSSGALPTGTNLTVGQQATSFFPTAASSPDASLSGGLTAVPEPGTLTLLIAAVVAGLCVWRKRRGEAFWK
jgi:autotransporter-associated beta strand protein